MITEERTVQTQWQDYWENTLSPHFPSETPPHVVRALRAAYLDGINAAIRLMDHTSRREIKQQLDREDF